MDGITRTHTQMGTFHRRNGCYTVQTVVSILTLTLNLPITQLSAFEKKKQKKTLITLFLNQI